MITGLTYILTSITLAILLPYLGQTAEPEKEGETTVYRLSEGGRKFFLLLVPAFGAMAAFVYSTYPLGEPKGVGLIGFISFSVLLLALPSAAYIYFNTFRIQIDGKSIRLVS